MDTICTACELPASEHVMDDDSGLVYHRTMVPFFEGVCDLDPSDEFLTAMRVAS